MKTRIHYKVEAKYWRREVPNIHDESLDILPTKFDIAETVTKFENESPILVRKAAFNHYSSIIDVLYNGLGKQRSTDAQARIDLQFYFDSGNAIELGGKGKKFKSSPDYDKCIEVYLIVQNLFDNIEENYLIHGVRYLDYPDRLDAGIEESLEGLIEEFLYYKENTNLNIEKLKFKAVDGNKTLILKTPFDWE
ncbi:hypothetical protein [Lacinutrix mariniflava]|uniref:hypothetical protein n=1 Tax=Lacinutrix mariniflava TaxID=342955 RepID=UPI0006E313ED|nr:hypothetical protein [Lacinutrix mariniflava]